jgi:hypothetical protein
MLEATTYPQQKSFLYKTLTTSLLELAAMEKSWKEFLEHPRKMLFANAPKVATF